MKKVSYLLIFGLMLSAFLCKKQTDSAVSAPAPTTLGISRAVSSESNSQRLPPSKIESEVLEDSLRLDRILSEALKIAGQNITRKSYVTEYQLMDDNLQNIVVEINWANHFSASIPHLIIRRSSPAVKHIDIFSYNNRQLYKIISHEQLALTYQNDTIQDINGDGRKDFVINGYGASGCCLKGFSSVYLLRTSNMSFSKKFEFLNPTFSPKEKVIRGVCYGHPGDTELYKYKWKGEAIDTVEYISFEKRPGGVKTGKIIATSEQPYKAKTLRYLKDVPEEYTTIEGYNWFTGKDY